LIDSVGRTTQTIVETYDRNMEASQLAANVEAAVAQVALMEIGAAGAVGLGTLIISVVASSAFFYITSVLAAGVLAIVGFFVIPYKRKQAKDDFKTKMEALRTKLSNALSTQFAHEAENVINRLKDGVTPYTRFVRAERERVEKTQAALKELRQRVSALQARSQVR
jgi:hypothetical protein